MKNNEGSTHFSRSLVMLGDVAVYLLATLLGFASHERLETAALGRMLATFVPFLVAWLALSAWTGVYRPYPSASLRLLGKALLATLFAAPLGAVLRGFWLKSPVIPLFVLLMAVVTAGLMLLWRGTLYLLERRSR